jgi:membrane protease YdiL (CAAX protease family)
MPRPHGVVLLLTFLVAALVTGAVLAPWLFRAGEWCVSMVHTFHHEKSPVLGWFAEKLEKSDFSKYFNRSMLISAVFWLWPFSRWAGMSKADLGLERNRLRWQDLLVGFMLASTLLMVMGFIYFQFGRFAANPKAAPGTVLGTSLFAAVCVALLEEWFFRGALFALLLRALKPIPALLFLSFFFAIIHLLQPPEDIVVADNAVEAGTGIWMVGQIFQKFGHANFLIAEGSTLFVVGLILGWARWQTRSLWLSIGLHAGWVFGIKLFAGLTRTPKGVDKTAYLPWIGADLRIGATPLIVLSFTGLLVLGWLVLRKIALKTMPREK